MLKLTLFLVLIGVCACLALPKNLLEITSAQVVAPANCTSIYSCVSEGDSCSGNYPGCNVTTGSTATCCAAGLTCTNGKCATDNMGSNCANISQCYSSLEGAMFNCVSGTCQYIYTIGDTCSNNTNCLPGLTCNNSTSTCQGLSYGQACVPQASQCNFGLYCGLAGIATFQCMNTTAQGAVCNSTLAPCYPGNDCINGTCAASGSGTQGQSCMTPSACGDDLTCASNGTCVGATTSISTCTQNSDCNSGAVCICSSFSGKAFCQDPLYNPCTSESSSLSSCMATHSCTAIEGTPNSCTYTNCYSSFKKANSCGCDASSTIFDTCAYNQYCGGFPVWAIILIIVVAIVLVLAIVLLVFFMMRRRRQYDSI